jgi:hypothetical protein
MSWISELCRNIRIAHENRDAPVKLRAVHHRGRVHFEWDQESDEGYTAHATAVGRIEARSRWVAGFLKFIKYI